MSKPKRTTPRKTVAVTADMQTLLNGLRRPFSTSTTTPNPALHRFGPARPTKPGTQI
jgi:hypothetical protein